MNCERCQELISAYIDGELSVMERAAVSTHFSICSECSKIHEDFLTISDTFDEPFAQDSLPPNSQALWCRINNIIESEVDEAQKQEPQLPPEKSRLVSRSWSFSAAQVFASVLLVAVVSSLVTLVAYKNFVTPVDSLSSFDAEPSVFDKVLSKLGMAETPAQKAQRRLDERRSAIEYWSKRVAQRRLEWASDTRITFDRNMDVIDKAVQQYTLLLRENPQDEISTEMLDSALNEKMELLREFSEL